MKSAIKAKLISDYFNKILPDAQCELLYNQDYELLIAVMLSAQTTDKAVNKVTQILFSKFKNLDELNNASIEEIEQCIHSLGLYKNKAKNIKGIVKGLIENFDYHVPQDENLLTTLPGVGRKTANVVRCELFSLNEFPVDTHINRIAKRLNIAKEEDDVYEVEMKLRKLFKGFDYIKLHHQFIHFGRYYCPARNPKCESCEICSICGYKSSQKDKLSLNSKV